MCQPESNLSEKEEEKKERTGAPGMFNVPHTGSYVHWQLAHINGSIQTVYCV